MTGRAVPSPKAVGKPGGFDAGRADRRRLFKGYASAALGILAVCTGLHGLARSDLPLGLLFSFGGAGLVLYAVGRFVLYRRLRKAGDLWRQVDGGVEFGPAPYPIWDYLSVAVTTIGALAPMAVILLAGSSYPRAFRVFLVAAELLLLCIAMGALLLRGGRGLPIIVMTPGEVRLRIDGPRYARIPWSSRPGLEQSVVHRDSRHALITTTTGQRVLLPMFSVPIGYAQLQAVLGFYATHDWDRAGLRTDEGLLRVRELTASPARTGERMEQAVSPYTGAPYQDSPDGGAPDAVTADDAPRDIGTPFTASETIASADGTGRRRRRFSCEEADCRMRDRPRWFLTGALVVFVASGCSTSVYQVGSIVLEIGASLLILLHGAVLSRAQHSRERAERRWTWGADGVRLRGIRFVPLAMHAEALALVVTAVIGMWLATVTDRVVGYDLGLPILLTAVLLLSALTVGATTFRARHATEITVNAEGLHLMTGPGRDVLLRWRDRPYIVGVDRRGAMVVDVTPGGETSVTLSAPPLLYTDLQRIVEFYANCPEASSELATEAGLARVRALSSRL